MEQERWNGNANRDYDYFESNKSRVNRVAISRESTPENVTNCLKLLPVSSSSGAGYIEHAVSKLDTLAGIAIKYGVEVADIKRMNGLVTDLQMFALKSLQIPLPGRHPPSPCLSSGHDTPGHCSSEQTPSRDSSSDLFETFQSLRLKSKSSQQKVSPAMSSLQGYYGLKPKYEKAGHEGFEMAVYRKGGSQYLEDGPISERLPHSGPPLSHHKKSRSYINGFVDVNVLPLVMPTTETGEGDCDKSSEKLVRRRQKSVSDFSHTPEMLLKEDSSGSSGFSSIAGKGLALRPKVASRTALASDSEAGGLYPSPAGSTEPTVADGMSGVRKSLSASSLQDQENGTSSSIWSASKWSLKPDLQVLSTAAIARPIFDGLPIPMTGRRNKAALD